MSTESNVVTGGFTITVTPFVRETDGGPVVEWKYETTDNRTGEPIAIGNTMRETFEYLVPRPAILECEDAIRDGDNEAATEAAVMRHDREIGH